MSHHEFDFEICNSGMRPIAEALVKKYEELKHVDPSKILFIVNHKSSGVCLTDWKRLMGSYYEEPKKA